MPNPSAPIVVKKYANRRLYNTASSVYVTLADLGKMVKAGEEFVVHDAKTNEDITRSVLTQIIFEQEGVEGQSLLPIAFLRHLIKFYGDGMQALVPSFLEFSMDRFAVEQEKVRASAKKLFGDAGFGGPAFSAMEELTRQNIAAFNQALGLFAPFAPATAGLAEEKPKAGEGIEDLRAQLAEMQRRLARIEDRR